MKKIAFVAAAASAAATTTAAVMWLAVPAGAAPAGRDVSGIEHFQLVTTSATATTQPVIATGVFTAGGVDHQGSKVDTFVFPGGSFKVAHSGPATQHFNPKTCLLTVVGHGTFKLSGGTGAYAKIKGAGTYKLNILAVGAKTATGKCTQKKPPTAFQQIIKATGKVSL